MPLSLNEIRDRATAFARDWRDDRGLERQESQTFWNEFFHVFGLNRRRVATFEKPVTDLLTTSRRGRVDLLWKGVLMVEHKSRGEDLTEAMAQARHYFPGLKDHELPRFVLASDFSRFRLHDLDAGTETDFPLRDLPRRIGAFGFLSGYETKRLRPLAPVDVEAADKLGRLHDLLMADGYKDHPLDVWMVRTLFCLFADSAGIWDQPGRFRALVERRTAEDGNDLGAWMRRLHRVLATDHPDRQASLDEDLGAFPYVNGRLFDEPVEEPATNRAMRDALLDCCATDWARVSPAVFGSLFQSIKDRTARRKGGEHYTTEANILKCLDPLFLDALRADLAAAAGDRRRLDAFLLRLRRIRVLDPACGCGNFLVVAYRELRALELGALRARHGDTPDGHALALIQSIVNVDQMFGLEVGDWPAQIATVALWLTDHQMNMALSDEFGALRIRLPLRTAPNIRVANALHEDWSAFLPPGPDTYCVGNPPFIGAKVMSASQRADMGRVFRGVRNAGLLDYVACWYRRAAEWMALDPRAEACFVSTNSITQGEQPAILWSDLLPRGVVVNFAHRTFHWTSEARGKAAVHCVIIGFALRDRAEKTLWDYERASATPKAVRATRINPYLVDAPVTALSKRSTPLCDAPTMAIGNQPIDGGYYLFTEEEKRAFLFLEPRARAFFRPWIGAEEFINGNRRWCLWLGDAEPSEIRAMPMVKERVDAVRKFRNASKRPQTNAIAKTPTRFFVENMPKRTYLVVPEVSSENREYIPMAFEPPKTLASNLLKIAPGATPYHFGILTSRMHMAWVRATCGRLESRYRYSTGIVYNNFPWPTPTPEARAKVEAAARAVVDARANHPLSTLADLYDPLAMPPDLARSHTALDRAVDAAYAQPRGFPTEAARLAFLFARHAALAAPLDAPPTARPTRRSARRRA